MAPSATLARCGKFPTPIRAADRAQRHGDLQTPAECAGTHRSSSAAATRRCGTPRSARTPSSACQSHRSDNTSRVAPGSAGTSSRRRTGWCCSAWPPTGAAARRPRHRTLTARCLAAAERLLADLHLHLDLDAFGRQVDRGRVMTRVGHEQRREQDGDATRHPFTRRSTRHFRPSAAVRSASTGPTDHPFCMTMPGLLPAPTSTRTDCSSDMKL